jgi:hypothetical protein
MTLYAFHPGNETTQDGHELWYSTYVDGSGWQPDAQPGLAFGGDLPYVVTVESPSPVEYNGNLYVFYQGYNYGLNYMKLDGTLWNYDISPGNENVGMSNSPSAAVYGDDLHVFHQGSGEDGQLYYSAYRPALGGWQPDTQLPNVGMSESPGTLATT